LVGPDIRIVFAGVPPAPEGPVFPDNTMQIIPVEMRAVAVLVARDEIRPGRVVSDLPLFRLFFGEREGQGAALCPTAG